MMMTTMMIIIWKESEWKIKRKMASMPKEGNKKKPFSFHSFIEVVVVVFLELLKPTNKQKKIVFT